MKEYISEQKSKGSTKSHKELFADGAKAWGIKKIIPLKIIIILLIKNVLLSVIDNCTKFF